MSRVGQKLSSQEPEFLHGVSQARLPCRYEGQSALSAVKSSCVVGCPNRGWCCGAGLLVAGGF